MFLKWRLNGGAIIVCIHALYWVVISSAEASIGSSWWVLIFFYNILPRRLKDEWLIRQERYSLLCFRVYVPEKCNMAMVASNMSGHIQKQLTRSLERILEEAHLSGELKLSGRKLKDFPKVGKTGSSKYNLQDTVIAGEFFDL